MHEPAYDEEVRAWQSIAFIYGYKDQTYRMAGYGAETLQALSSVLERIYHMLFEFVECGIHIRFHDLNDVEAINMLLTQCRGEIDMSYVSDIAITSAWIGESRFRLNNKDATELTLQIGKPLTFDNSWFCPARIAGLGEAKYYAARDAVTSITAAMRGIDGELSRLGLTTVVLENEGVLSFEKFRSYFFRSFENGASRRKLDR